jgi:hypothetical protein
MTAYNDVKWMQQYGQDVARLFNGIQPRGEKIGFYHPSPANWSYEFKIVKLDGKLYEVMTRFGDVEGGREVLLPDNKGMAGL